MKRLLLLLFCLPLFAAAQNTPLLIQGASPATLYINHTVAPKENYYSIGRLYNISPKEIAPFNKLKLEAGLSLGQTIMIPLTDNNFLQSGNPAPDEALVPVYYTVHDKEGFYRISVNNNKVPIVSVKKWNNITADGVSSGTPLIIGFLKVKKEVSLLANTATLTPDQVKAAIQPPQTTPVSTASTSTQIIDGDKHNQVTSGKALPMSTAVTVKSTPPVKPSTPIIDGDKHDPVMSTTTVTVKSTPLPVKPVKEIAEPTEEETPQPTVTFKQDNNKTDFKGFNGGAFKTDFDKHSGKNDIAQDRGDAAIFKSNSGWQDGRYYCLYDYAQAGTIVKITNNTTGKIIYAKILDAMPDMKQNTGILLRISNAAAEELGVTDVKFDCTVNYYK
jgi:hypothetical protein